MMNQRHSHAGRLLKKVISVTLSATMLSGMAVVGNVFGTTAYAAETRTEGDYSYVILNDGTAQITKYNGEEAQLTTPAKLGDATVTEIGTRAFADNDDIVSVTFSEGLVTIGEHAFAGCDLLEELDFAPTVTTIGAWSFENCRALQSVEIPSNVKTIREKAFSACPILVDVKLNEGLETMGFHFLAGTPVSEIYIPSTVTKSDEPFAEMEMLETVRFAEGITAIPRDMFEDNNSIRSLTIPDTVTTLGNDSLCQMRSLESIVIPDSVTEWGDFVLYECDSLASVTIGKGVTNIPSSAFTRCKSLTEINIPDNVTSIGSYAFFECSKLATVNLPDGLTELGNECFAKTDLTEITLPATVTKGCYPFNNCSKLKTIHFSDGVKTFITGLLQNTPIESIAIPEGVTEIAASMFQNCKSLATVTLPSTLRTIKEYAFTGCTALNHVDIPKSVKKIEGYAFSGTTSLTDFTLREGVQTLGTHIFSDSALTTVYIPKTLSETSSPFAGSNLTDPVFADGIATLTGELFYGAKNLTKVKIPDTVIKISNSCFRATNLESIIIPDTVRTLGDSVFEECDNLYAARIGSGLRKLPNYCFYGCDVLQNVVIPETIYELGIAVFQGSGLTYQILPQSIHTIPSATFKDCQQLATVECSDQLESIGDYSFERCYELTSLVTDAEPSFNNTTFKGCPKFTDQRFSVFNLGNTGIESTGNIGADHTLVHFAVKYDIRDDWADEDIKMSKLFLNLPNNMEIITTSFSAEGFDFDNSAYTGDYKSFSLSGGKTRGELRFSAYVNTGNDDAIKNVSAEVEFTYKNNYFKKPVGEVQFAAAKLSLFAPSNVTESKIVVSGYTASAGKDVTVTISRLNDDGTKDCSVSHTVTPNKYTGKYISEGLSIVPEGKVPVNEDRFEVVAECNGVKSDVVGFTYTPGALKVVQATETVNIRKFIAPGKTNLSHSNQGNTYDITGIFTRGTSPVISINPAEMLQFKFKLENDENISTIILMSHKGSDWRYMELFYNAVTDTWIGEGYFDIIDHEIVPGYNYVPGALNMMYICGERKDTYHSVLYGENDGVGASGKDISPVGEVGDSDVPYYVDKYGREHGNPGDYNKTARDTGIKIIKDIFTGNVKGVLTDGVTGGLKWFTQWGRTNHNLVRTLNHGIYLDDNGLPVLPGDKPNGGVLNNNPDKDGRQRNVIDPSGVVYEAVKGNFVENATATILKLNEESGEWEEWNAADFEQQNPLLTNSEGAYSWLTDEGRFKVTVSKEGYETQTSEEFDIPPEKLGLDFSLVDNTTHPTAAVTADEERGSFTLKFSKFMKPETVTAETVQIEGLKDVSIEPVYLNEGDEFADTFTIKGTPQQKELKFAATDAAQSYSGVSAEPTTSELTVEVGILGDVNGDNKVDISDVTLIQQFIADVPVPDPVLVNLCGDVNNDGKIDINDATDIQKYVADIKLPYPIGEPV